MRKIKEVLRLKWSKNLSNRRIASSCGIGCPTVSEYLRRVESAGLSWPLPENRDTYPSPKQGHLPSKFRKEGHLPSKFGGPARVLPTATVRMA